jgi:hypothetical protein
MTNKKDFENGAEANPFDNFFPDDYKVPTDAGSFMKLENGDNTFRVLSKPVIGYEYWTGDNKPIRSREKPEETPNIKLTKEGKATPVKHFWSFLVYNYRTESVQSFEITQSSIMKALKALIENPKWGSPMKYDVTINKTGQDLLTKYAVVPNPHSPLTPEIEKALEATDIDLETIFDK